MPILVSPGVAVTEQDATNTIPAVSTSIGGYVGEFRWGPVDLITTVSSEKDLAYYYGAPTAPFARSFLTAASFLKYGNTLKISRAIDQTGGASPTGTLTAYNAASILSGTNIPVYKNIDNYTASTKHTDLRFAARYPGAIANGLTVYVVAGNTTATLADSIAGLFDYLPSTLQPTVSQSGTASSGSTAVTLSAANTSIKAGMLVTGTGIAAGTTVATYAGSTSLTLSQNSSGAVSGTLTFSALDEVHIAVVDTTGLFSGVAGTVLEKFSGLSMFTDSKRADGTNNHYVDYVNANSAYIYANKLTATANVASGTALTLPAAATSTAYVFANGSDGSTTALSAGLAGVGGNATGALYQFQDADTVDLNLLFCSDLPTSAGPDIVASATEVDIMTLVTNRKDCLAFISAPITISNKTNEKDKLTLAQNKFSDSSIVRNSYIVLDSTPLYVYNKYQDTYTWIPACGHLAGLCANTDNVADTWFSPAGYNRGALLGVTKLAFNPSQTSRDTLYQLGVNPIVAFPGQGILLYGDKTAQTKPSAFDRINVRRLFMTLEKAIAKAAKYQLFEFNDEFTQAMFRNMVEPFLRDVKGRRGITDFLVVCDSTNNTPQVVDSNRFIGSIYIKPARSINFMELNFIATRTGVSFSEIAGQVR